MSDERGSRYEWGWCDIFWEITGLKLKVWHFRKSPFSMETSQIWKVWDFQDVYGNKRDFAIRNCETYVLKIWHFGLSGNTASQRTKWNRDIQEALSSRINFPKLCWCISTSRDDFRPPACTELSISSDFHWICLTVLVSIKLSTWPKSSLQRAVLPIWRTFSLEKQLKRWSQKLIIW